MTIMPLWEEMEVKMGHLRQEVSEWVANPGTGLWYVLVVYWVMLSLEMRYIFWSRDGADYRFGTPLEAF